MGEALLLLEAELSLLRGGLRARQGEVGAGRVALLRYRGHGIGARAIHLRVCDGAGIDEARGVVHAVLRRLEVHGGRRERLRGGYQGRCDGGTVVVESEWRTLVHEVYVNIHLDATC